MRKPFWFFAVLAVFLAPAYGGEPEIIWRSSFPSVEESVVWDAVENPAGIVFSVGETAVGTDGRRALNLCAFKPDGSILWERTALSLGDAAGFSAVTVEDGFIVCGSVKDTSCTEGFLMRLDSEGNTLWTAREGYSGEDSFNDIVQTPEGLLLAAGYSFNCETGDRDILAACFTDSGTVLWKKRFTAPGYQTASSIIADTSPEGGYLITGSDQGDAFLMKIDKDGNWSWKTIHSIDGHQTGTDIAPLADGGYIVTGSTRQGALFSDALMVFFDSGGMVVSDYSWGRDGPDMARAVIEVPPAGFAVLVNSNSGSGEGYRPWLIRFDPWLSRIWQMELTDSDAIFYSVSATHNGGFLVSGKVSLPGTGAEYSSHVVKISPEDLFNWD